MRNVDPEVRKAAIAVADEREVVKLEDEKKALRVLREAEKLSRLDAYQATDGTWRVGPEFAM